MKALYALLLASLLAAGFILPAGAGNTGPKNDLTQLAVATFTFEQTNGFAEGKYIDWSNGTTQVKVTLVPDLREGTDPDAGVSEWSMEAFASLCGERRYLIDSRAFVNDPTYGPRINDFLNPGYQLASRTRSVIVVHDGTSPGGDGGPGHEHVNDLGPGRHEMSCVNT